MEEDKVSPSNNPYGIDDLKYAEIVAKKNKITIKKEDIEGE